jgi:Fe-S-cluster containining protein
VLIAVEHRTPEFNNLSQVSIFALPKFDPEKEMRMLQNLWSKRCSIGDPQPLICRTTQEIVDDGDDPQERSFFETDSDSEDEEVAARKFISHVMGLIVGDRGSWDEGTVVAHFQPFDGR